MVEVRDRQMASEVRVVATGGPRMTEATLTEVVQRRLRDLEARWSRFRPDSDITRLNTASGRWVEVAPDTIVLVQVMAMATELTDGAFDPAILRAVMAAGYDHSLVDGRPVPELGFSPPLASVLHPSPGLASLEIDVATNRVRIAAGVAIDPGGIGKGLAADLVADELAALGCRSIMASVGGDLRILEDHAAAFEAADHRTSSTEPWTIDVIDPWEPEAVLMSLSVDRGGVATSALHPGRINAHLPKGHVIDPRTGALVESDVAAATVIAPTAWRAEALATAVLVDGFERGAARCARMGATAIAVTTDGTVLITDAVGPNTPSLRRRATPIAASGGVS